MINDFKTDYILRYEDIFNKTSVSKKISSFRFEPNLVFGDTVIRNILDLSGVRVRSFTNQVDRTIDALTDSTESMPINVQVGAVYKISRLEEKQAGPLSPAMVAGKNIAIKVANHLDAVVLAETRNAYAVFDTGNLTTSSSSGVPFALNSTTVPQMVAQTYAKLYSNNIPMTSLAWVLDPFSVSLIAQFPIGKEITNANTVFVNGFSGNIFGTQIYTSNNLTGEAVLTSTGVFSDGDTVTIGGVVFTAKTILGTTAGNFLIGANAAASLTNLTALLNDPTTTTTEGVAVSSADQITLIDVLGIGSARANGVAVTTTATAMTIVGVGSSRLTLSETAGNFSWTGNFIHCYYGQKSAIDVAVQDKPTMEVREEAKQLTKNIFNDIVAAVKTFSDGSQKFLDVQVSNL